MNKFIIILTALFCAILIAWSMRNHSPHSSIIPASIEDSITKYSLNRQQVKVYISKSDYILKLFIGNKLVKIYPCVLGPNPVDDKKQEGDGCTPEGFYKIKAKYPHKSWSYFLWIDYPNEAAQKRFSENKLKGVIPKNAGIGGEVGIHGVPFKTGDFGKETPKGTPHNDALIDEKINWTAGCISLKTGDITEIYKYVPVGSEVEIVH